MDESGLDTIQIDNFPAASRSLRIACVTETYPPEVNGVACTMACIVEGLHRRNHDVQLVRPRQTAADAGHAGPGVQHLLMRGLPIPQYPHLRMGLPAKQALVRQWVHQRPDVVHIATEGPLGWSALQAALKLKLPVASDFRTNFHNYSRHYRIGWLSRPILAYLRKFHNRTGCTMVPTTRLRGELEAQGFERLAVVGRGVDTQRFDPRRRRAELRAAWGAGPQDLVLLYVGRLAAEKNLDTLLAAFAAVQELVPAARLVLVGDGPLRAALQQRCPQAVFAGQRGGDDLAEHYASADLFAFPSETETFGNVTVEALASGLPVVAFNLAAAAQLVQPDVHGLLARPGDNDSFLHCVRLLAADPSTRDRMRAQARQRALEIDWTRIVRDFEDVLFSTIRRSQEAALPGLATRAAA
jgi:glycosyltransferase involved in cell wall biosynthesis